MILSLQHWRRLVEARDRAALLQSYREEAREPAKVVAQLEFLLDLGLIDQSGYRKEIAEIVKVFKKWTLGNRLNPREKEDLEILMEIGEESGLTSLKALSSTGAKALFDLGLRLVSSPTQLINGTLVFSMDPNYRRADGWGLGFFPGPKKLRRMAPKATPLGVWGRPSGSMDVMIKSFPNTSSDLDFFDTAMQWAAQNIDFTQVELYPEPSQWKYYKKKKGKISTRDEADDLLVKAAELENSATAKYKKDIFLNKEPIDYWLDRIAAAELRLNAYRLGGKTDGINHEIHRIKVYREQIEKIKQAKPI